MEFNEIECRYKQIEGFDDYYITEFGDVYSTRPIGASKTHKLHKLKPKNPGRPEKYLNIILCRDDGQYTKSIHRLVAENFVDGYFEGAVPNHIDGNNRNNAYTNLEWVTVKENVHKSYDTSGVPPTRNYMVWHLFDPDDELVASFGGHIEMERYVVANNIDASPSSLSKYLRSHGYYVVKEQKPDVEISRNCNDHP